MAKEIIDVGSSLGAGDGDLVRNALIKVNNNFTELYNTQGWGYYKDGETSPATQDITTTPSYLQVDGLHAKTNTDYLPNGVDLFDVVNNKITPINVGDSYNVRIDLEIFIKSGNPTIIDFHLDIGGTTSITLPIVERIISTSKTPPYSISVGFPFFSLSTFKTNGGRLFLATDTGTITISARAISIYRISSGLI